MSVRAIRDEGDRGRLITEIGARALPFTVSMSKGARRSDAQNRTVHRWFGEIAAHDSDHPANVKAYCNMIYGRPILLAEDPEWAEMFNAILRPLPYETALKAIQVLDIPFTRRMTTRQLSTYMDAMFHDYTARGVRLTDPEGLKYAAEMEGAA